MALTAIRFNGEPGAPGVTGLNLRKNARDLVPVPEWVAGVSVNAQHSPAAYVTSSAWGRPVMIQAKFARTTPALPMAEVRAVPAPPETGPFHWLEEWLGQMPSGPGHELYQAWRRTLAGPGHVLGEVKARWITFLPSGESGFQWFELPDHRLWSAGVGIHQVEWRWQYRENPFLPWKEFAQTRHRIYTVLEAPKAPWQQLPFTPGNTQLPWTDVLDYACRWAAGAQSTDAAATAITQAVFNLGPAVLEYGCPIFALTQYSLLYFDCTAFLDRLAGGFGNGPYVNCTDCATIVSTFANCLGCDLWQSRMRPGIGLFFNTNPVRAIGSNLWTTPCGLALGFQYHEVAWKGACSYNDEIFDACLLLNRNFNPALPPYLPLLPANLPFASPFGGDYRDRLVTAAAQFNCVPDPWTRVRRAVG